MSRDLLHDRRDRGGALSDDVVHIPETDGESLVEEEAPGRRFELVGFLGQRRVAMADSPEGELEAIRAAAQPDLGVKGDASVLPGLFHVVQVTEDAAFALRPVNHERQVVDTEHHVLTRHRDRAAGRRRKDVVGRQHEHAGLGLSFGRQRQMHGHLVAVEVSVERGADKRVDLDRLALDENRLEGLDPEAVQGGRPVQEDRVLLDDLVEHVPDLNPPALDHPLGGLYVLGDLGVDEPLHHERLEELERHQLGQAALMELERGTDDDDRAARVVDSLAQEVLAEAALLSFQHVGQALERPVAGTRHRAATPPVVEEGVHCLLEHPLLVVDDDLGRTEVEQTLQAVVPVDDAPVEVVEVRSREASAVQLNHRPQVRRDHRHGIEDHRPGVVDPPAGLIAAVERGDDLQALDGLLLALGRQRPPAVCGLDVLAELELFLVKVEAVDQPGDRLGSHPALEVIAVPAVELPPQELVLDDLAPVKT